MLMCELLLHKDVWWQPNLASASEVFDKQLDCRDCVVRQTNGDAACHPGPSFVACASLMIMVDGCSEYFRAAKTVTVHRSYSELLVIVMWWWAPRRARRTEARALGRAPSPRAAARRWWPPRASASCGPCPACRSPTTGNALAHYPAYPTCTLVTKPLPSPRLPRVMTSLPGPVLTLTVAVPKKQGLVSVLGALQPPA